jgi:hypothetical protein
MPTTLPHSEPWLLQLKPLVAEDGAAGAAAPSPPAGGLPGDTLGLALSGEGVRSAAFCLGVVQSLARAGWLRRVDFLSTVSGGGYSGAFLGRFFDLCAKPGGLTGAVPDEAPGAAQERVARDLRDGDSAPLRWLRQNANYLSPTGLGETSTNLAGFWRNLLSVQLVLAVFVFAVFGVLNAVNYSSPYGAVKSSLAGLLTTLTPLAGNLTAQWPGPWAGLAEILLWLAVLPLMAAYWLVSQDQQESFIPPALVAAGLVSVSLLVATSSPLSVLVFAATVGWALEAWVAVRRSEGPAVDPRNPYRLLRARNHLTARLAFWLSATVLCAVLGVVDWLGRWLAQQMLAGGPHAGNVTAWLASMGGSLLALVSFLRMASGWLVTRAERGSSLFEKKWPYVLAVAVLIFAVLPILAALSFASHAAYRAGAGYGQGLAATALAVAVSLLLGTRACVPFINRSGPLAIYASRLARAFLGAVNPQRRLHPEGRNVTYMVPGDDVAFDQYAPHAAGGPLHLINCAVNATLDVASQRGLRDRRAENLAVGPAGVNIAQQWQSLWAGASPRGHTLVPLAAAGGPHPFLDRAGDPVPVEALDLREWVAISGTDVSPGMGRNTGLGKALLFTLANLRLGYWWNSGLNARERQDEPVKCGLWRVVTEGLSHWFRAQALLVSELLGRFGGPWYRYWYLSDGGNFEGTGAYELLRRRVPFVIVCDAGRDQARQGADIGDLVRLARVDLGAETEEIAPDPVALQQQGVPGAVAPYLGSRSDLLTAADQPCRKHAALFLVRHPAGPPEPSGDPWVNRRHTWLLYLKATVTGDEPADVLNYAALHPDFPNETTLDQLFDEPQWESYRKLGEHVGENLFVQDTQKSCCR